MHTAVRPSAIPSPPGLPTCPFPGLLAATPMPPNPWVAVPAQCTMRMYVRTHSAWPAPPPCPAPPPRPRPELHTLLHVVPTAGALAWLASSPSWCRASRSNTRPAARCPHRRSVHATPKLQTAASTCVHMTLRTLTPTALHAVGKPRCGSSAVRCVARAACCRPARRKSAQGPGRAVPGHHLL